MTDTLDLDVNALLDESMGESAAETGKKAPEKKKGRPSQSELLVKLALGNVAELFHDPDGCSFAVLPVATGGREHLETWKLRGKGFKSWLCRLFWIAEKKAPGSQAVADAIGVLEGFAIYEGEERETFVRIGGTEGAIYVDLGDEHWSAVEVTAEGWRIVSNPPVRFRRPKSLRPLPVPEPGGDLERDLRPLLNIPDDTQWVRAQTWLVGSYRPKGPHHMLVIQGEQGSGKSLTARRMRQTVDPASLVLRSAPREERDLAVACRSGHVLAYDNLSGIPSWLSDAFCRIATGGGFGTRQLYSDDEEALFDLQAPILLNGIDDMLERPDLAERSLTLNLPAIPDEERRDEKSLDAEFLERWPRIFGALLDAVACSLSRVDEVQLEVSPRMADAARWATAAEPALGLAPGAVVRAIQAGQEEALHQGLESEPVAQALLVMLDEGRQVWTGSPSQLLKEFHSVAQELATGRGFPKSPGALGNRLTRVAPSLRRIGVQVLRHRTKHGRTVEVRDCRGLLADHENDPAD